MQGQLAGIAFASRSGSHGGERESGRVMGSGGDSRRDLRWGSHIYLSDFGSVSAPPWVPCPLQNARNLNEFSKNGLGEAGTLVFQG